MLVAIEPLDRGALPSQSEPERSKPGEAERSDQPTSRGLPGPSGSRAARLPNCAEAQEVRHADEPQDQAHRQWDALATLVMNDLGVGHAVFPSSGEEPSLAGGDHIPHPLGVASVCESDPEAIHRWEDVNRGPILLSRSASGVNHDPECGQAPSERQDKVVCHPSLKWAIRRPKRDFVGRSTRSPGGSGRTVIKAAIYIEHL